jgi:hypothetical protein
MDFSSEMAMLDICDDSVRTLDDYQVELLRANLFDFHDCLVDEGSDIINAYDNSLIESLDNLQFLKISHFLPVFEAGYYYCKYGSMLYRSTCIINNNDIYMIQ